MKLARFTGSVLALALSPGCGYRSANDAATAPAAGYSVAAAPMRAPHLDALAAALAGARAELGKEGALRTGSGFPRVVVELVRVDEIASGIAAVESPTGARPLARGSAVGVTARAWVEARVDAPPTLDSGDVRRVQTVAQGEALIEGGAAQAEAVRSAARRAGAAVARRVLGLLEPGGEEL